MLPEGESSVAAPGGETTGRLKFIVALHGPYPPAFQVWIHQVCAPPLSAVSGAAEQSRTFGTASKADAEQTHSKENLAQ